MSIHTKTIKGKQYLYFAHYVKRKKFEIYCGPAFNSKSKKKALRLELLELEVQKKRLSVKVRQVKNRLKLLA